ncbi:MAG: 4-(cytidine 5'-diphospho)-2-C-methyl-D-erythritol kinase [Deltaproteobacteria bacterium]|nr:4-(cytidine 5'-diphospho)-2-C-methyl-D-erythritol kinase [Deltaproteobacteria bacterium]
MSRSKTIVEFAPAKLNLGLRIVGRRADGYHQLDSVFVPVSLWDVLQVTAVAAAKPSVTLSCRGADLPLDRRNLAARAAWEFMEEFCLPLRLQIALQKNIPQGAGLGGGSSDAAATLRALARMAAGGTPQRLDALAVRLGADVPFFLRARPARVTGIGERIEPIELAWRYRLLLAIPPLELSTARVFAALKPAHWTGPIGEQQLRAIRLGSFTSADLANDLTAAALALAPVVAKLKVVLEHLGARAVSMTGSGSAVFGAFDNGADVDRAAALAAQHYPAARFAVVETLRGLEELRTGASRSAGSPGRKRRELRIDSVGRSQ